MNIYIESCQYFWFKFKRRAFQYFIEGLKNPKWILMFCLARIQIFRSLGIYLSKRSWDRLVELGINKVSIKQLKLYLCKSI